LKKLLTPEDLSDILQVKLSTIYYWTHIGEIPFLKIGKALRFREDEILIWLRKKEAKNRHRRITEL
jgi:excisionase family DNA binding protein